MLKIIFILGYCVLCSNAFCDPFPEWPANFQWSENGEITGMTCTAITEEDEPQPQWDNNFFCVSNDIGMEWSSTGPIADKRCTRIVEPNDPHGWDDNYLCVPHWSPYIFEWSFSGQITGKDCIQWTGSQPVGHRWDNNYLCADTFPIDNHITAP
ncbi:uncharacterized protein [Clytia hemisphaerica]|uniref:Cnidarian restricted protein n=1 Tax=Clytia hemisphaerica TaxID=252671 RepID=A0A7M5U6W8_9CNID